MNIFLPPIDSIWRFKADWSPPDLVKRRHDNNQTLLGYPSRYGGIDLWKIDTGRDTTENDWIKSFHAWEDARVASRNLTFVAGTVMQFDRYHVSRSGEDQITCKLLASPNPLLHPKKLKGKMAGPGRVYFSLEEINLLPELERANELEKG